MAGRCIQFRGRVVHDDSVHKVKQNTHTTLVLFRQADKSKNSQLGTCSSKDIQHHQHSSSIILYGNMMYLIALYTVVEVESYKYFK